MADPWFHLVERRIAEAERRGEFEELPGRGRPLALPDLRELAPELRSSYILLKTHGFLPPELEGRKAWLRLEDLLAACADPAERRQLERQARRAQVRYRLLIEQRGGSVAAAEYRDRVIERLTRE
ncbi:MAG: DUF1992 domain-containing protein [bacterium]|nr:DUF1992 domain-containing protein [bacterium]